MLLYPVNLLLKCFRYFSSNTLVVSCRITLDTLTYSLYSLKYSLKAFSCTATYTNWVLPVTIGIGPSL